jgi:hypothetical protein
MKAERRVSGISQPDLIAPWWITGSPENSVDPETITDGQANRATSDEEPIAGGVQ